MPQSSMECSFDGCPRPARTNYLCASHYQQKYLGRPLTPLRETPLTTEERFWAKVRKTAGCWEWMAGKNDDGYGNFRVGRLTGKAHRFSYELANGPIPEGKHIDHVCHNPGCVNPGHLRIVTHKQNMENMHRSKRWARSGYRGVYWHDAAGKWNANVTHDGVRHNLGYYDSADEAGAVAKAARLRFYTHNETDKRAA